MYALIESVFIFLEFKVCRQGLGFLPPKLHAYQTCIIRNALIITIS